MKKLDKLKEEKELHKNKKKSEYRLTKQEYIAVKAIQGILAARTKEDLKLSFEDVIPKLVLMYTDKLINIINKQKEKEKI